jgi:uncharacterized protein YukE
MFSVGGLVEEGDGEADFSAVRRDTPMAQQFGVKPDELRAVSTHMGELGSRASGLMSAAQAQIAAKGPCWGEGQLGSQFADGPNGFVSQLARVAQSVHAKATLLNYYADQLKYTADVSQRSDQL